MEHVIRCMLLALLPVLPAQAGLFDPRADVNVPAFVRQAVVCVGENAPSAEQQVAQYLAEKLRAAGAPENGAPQTKLMTAEALNDDPVAAGTHHIIAVGTWLDNVVMRKTWGHWAMTPWQRAQLERDYQASREGRPASMLTTPDAGPDWRYTGDFFAFGFGHFTGSVGYVEPGRNPYALQLIPNELGPKPADMATTDQFFVIKITGTDPEGIARAGKAFAEGSLLHGVIPAAGVKLPADWRPDELGAPQFPTVPPAWASIADLPGEKPLRCLGWMQGYSLLYAGFTEASGVAPKRLWRIKYQTPAGIKDYPSFLTPRASGNELLIAEVADGESARKAVDGLRTSTGTNWQPFAVQGWRGFRSAEGHTFVQQGVFVLGETLPPGFDEALLKTIKAPQ